MPTPKKKVREYATMQVVFRTSNEYRHWLRCLAADSGLSISEFLELCCNEYAKKHSLRTPPRRWPPETE
jgi:hypothetical protein